MTKEQFDKMLQRYLRDECTEEEIRRIDRWIENMQGSADEITVHDDKKEIIRRNVWVKTEAVEGQVLAGLPVNPGLNSWKWTLRIAASIAVIAFSLFLFFNYTNTPTAAGEVAFESLDIEVITFRNTTNKATLIRLADGSTVLVHPGSQIKYPKTFGAKREISLSGEAFFDVAKDREHPFLVYSNELTTRVLGTSFLIKAYDDQKDITVSVNTGRVSVFSKQSASRTKQENEELTLTPNQRAVYSRHNHTVERRLVDSPRIVIDNQPRNIAYTNEPAGKLFKTLEKMYGVTIQYNERALADCTITTELTNEDLFQRMDIICLVLGAEYTVEGTVIVVEADGCSD